MSMRRVNRTGIKKDITYKGQEDGKKSRFEWLAMENLKTKPTTLTLKKGVVECVHGSWRFCKCENFPYIQLS